MITARGRRLDGAGPSAIHQGRCTAKSAKLDEALRRSMALLTERLERPEEKLIDVAAMRLDVVADGRRGRLPAGEAEGAQRVVLELQFADTLPARRCVPAIRRDGAAADGSHLGGGGMPGLGETAGQQLAPIGRRGPRREHLQPTNAPVDPRLDLFRAKPPAACRGHGPASSLHVGADSPLASGGGREAASVGSSRLVRTVTLQTANRSPAPARARRYLRVGARGARNPVFFARVLLAHENQGTCCGSRRSGSVQ